MNLTDYIPRDQLAISLAEKIRLKYLPVKGKCQFIARDLVRELNDNGISARHISGIFSLDKPAVYIFSPNESDGEDDYSVNHDWVEIEGKILDPSADQFQKYVDTKIPVVEFIDYNHPLFTKYNYIKQVE